MVNFWTEIDFTAVLNMVCNWQKESFSESFIFLFLQVDAAFGLQIEFQDYSTFLKYAPIKRVSHLLAIAWTY